MSCDEYKYVVGSWPVNGVNDKNQGRPRTSRGTSLEMGKSDALVE